MADKIKKEGKKWFAQNFELAFLGSSSTLINEEALKSFEPLTDDEVIFNSFPKNSKIPINIKIIIFLLDITFLSSFKLNKYHIKYIHTLGLL